MPSSVDVRYLRLGLRLDRLVEGTVDAYFGPRELAEQVRGEAPPDPRALVADAEELLAEVTDGWLGDQVRGLRTFAGVLAGEDVSYTDEVAGCYGVPVGHTDESVFAAAHERLADVLPGAGSVADRYHRWRESMLVPEDLIEATVRAVIAAAREQTHALVGLPDGEGVDIEIVRDAPWLGYQQYLGDLRGQVSVNVTLPMTAVDLLDVALHETYPGHQTERAVNDETLVTGAGMLEESIVLVPTPQSVVSEGIAQVATRIILHDDGGEEIVDLVRAAGVPVDLPLLLAVDEAAEPCRWAEVNAALMVHDRGVQANEVQAYLERWGLMAPELAAHIVRFLTESSPRSYLVTYPVGLWLCSAYVGKDRDRFRHLLTHQVRVGDLLAATR